nr:zinc finger, CCHC-type [Tanacetum cinerariifolium]
MHFSLTTLKVVYVLNTPMPELMEDDTVEAIRMLNRLRSCGIHSNLSTWQRMLRDFKHTLKHGKDDLSLVQLDSHLCIEEYLRAHDSVKGKGKEVDGPSVNMTEDGKNKNNKQNKGKKCGFKKNNSGSSSNKKPKCECWNVVRLVISRGFVVVVIRKTKMLVVRERGLRTNHKTKVDAIAWYIDSSATTHVCKDCCWFKTYEPVKDGSVLYMGDDHFAPVHEKESVVLEFSLGKSITLFNVLYVPKLRKNLISGPVLNKCVYKQVYESDKAVVRLSDPKRKTLNEKGIDCIFVAYAENSKAYRFYVIEPNDSISINSIIESRDAIFDENHFSSIPRPKDIIPNSVESQRDDHSDDVSNETPEPCKVDKTKKFLSSKFSTKDIGEADIILGIKIKRENKGIVITQSHYIEKILKKFNHEDCSSVSTPMDPVEKIKPNTGKPVDQLEYLRAIGCLIQHWHAITRVFKYLKGTMNYGLSYVGYPSVLEDYSDASWINHVEDSSSTSGWMFLLGGGAISWASKKQTCITGSTMEYEFVALAVAGKEVKWLKNLIHEILI